MSNPAKPKSWRDVIKVHPAADLLPMMSPDELKTLGEDIKANGFVERYVRGLPPELGELLAERRQKSSHD